MSAGTDSDTALAARTEGSDAELQARIFQLVHPTTPLTRQGVDGLLEETFAAASPDLAAELVMTVLGRDALGWARELADRASQHFTGNVRLEKIVRLIAPPRIVPSPPLEKIDRRPDFEWLKAHATEYRGEWLVLCHGRLWGHARALDDAKKQARDAGLTHRPLVYRVVEEEYA